MGRVAGQMRESVSVLAADGRVLSRLMVRNAAATDSFKTFTARLSASGNDVPD